MIKTNKRITHTLTLIFALCAYSASQAALTETWTLTRYNNSQMGVETATTQRFSRFSDAKLDKVVSPVITSRTSDTYTGKVLRKRYGKKQAYATTFSYDALQRVGRTTYRGINLPSETEKRDYIFTASGSQEIVQHPNGYVTTIDYSPLHKKIAMSDNLHGKMLLMRYVYNDQNQLKQEIDRHGIETDYVYDATLRKLSTTNIDGDHQRKKIFRYDDIANKVYSHQEGGLVGEKATEITGDHTQTFNTQQKLIDETVSARRDIGQQHGMASYNNFGDVVKRQQDVGSQDQSNLRQIQSKKDALGNTIETTIAATEPNDIATTTQTHYDLNNQLVDQRLFNANNTKQQMHRYQFVYDGLKRQVLERRDTDNQPIQQTIVYTDNGDTATKTDWTGHQWVTHYGYVLGKRVILSKINPDTSSYYFYNPASTKLIGVGNTSNAQEADVTYDYRLDGLPLHKYFSDGKQISYQYYDANANKNSIDRLKSSTDILGLTTTRTYQAFGELDTTTVTDSASSQLAATVRTPTPLGKLQRVDRYQGKDEKIDTIIYTMGKFDQYIKTISIQNAKYNGNVKTIEYQRYNDGNIQHKTVTQSDGAISNVDYQYDNRKRVLRSTSQLTSADGINSDSKPQYFVYDLNNNLINTVQQESQVGSQGLAISAGLVEQQYAYDKLDQLRQINRSTGADVLTYQHGNLTQDSNGNYDYNGENQLTEFTDKRQLSTHYAYRADDSRKSKTQLDTTIHFYEANHRVSNAIDNHGNQSAYFNDGQVQARFLFNQGKWVSSEFYGVDAHGSVISGVTLSQDKKVSYQHYAYSSAGTLTQAPSSQGEKINLTYNPLQYSSRHYVDQESGLVYYGARYLRGVDARVAQFITLDYGRGGKLSNLKQFVAGDAVNLGDVDGHLSIKINSKILNAVGMYINFSCALGPVFGFLYGSNPSDKFLNFESYLAVPHLLFGLVGVAGLITTCTSKKSIKRGNIGFGLGGASSGFVGLHFLGLVIRRISLCFEPEIAVEEGSRVLTNVAADGDCAE